jgi:threonine aldolase
MIDLRSDTVTRPTPEMREAMVRAELGDDVFGDDPTVRALEEEVARITGKEAALFVPSGTMGNQLAIATQTRSGDEVIVGEAAHPLYSEAGGAASLSGVQLTAVGRGGTFTADDVAAVVQPKIYWATRASLVSIENTHNRAGGRVWPLAQAHAVAERAHAMGLAAHFDGARVWNAAVASGVDVATWCGPFDTASVCFSKGLGAPVGSALCGPRGLIERAHRTRKMWGAGMRQAGVLAAAALYALKHNRERLAEDHANAKLFAETLATAPGVSLDVARVETNIVNVDLDEPLRAERVASLGREEGVAINASGPRRLRAVTHLDVSRTEVETAARILGQAVQRSRAEVQRA